MSGFYWLTFLFLYCIFCIVVFFSCPYVQTLTQICFSSSARGTRQHHRWNRVHGGLAVIFLFTRTLIDSFIKLQTFCCRKHSFCFQDGTEQTPATSLPFIWTSVVLKGNNIVNLLFCPLRKLSHIIALFQANNYYPLNVLADLWALQPLCFCQYVL